MERSARIIRDVKLGAVLGMLFGVILSAVVLIILLIRGSQPVEHNQTTLLRTIATYLLAFGLAGVLLGLLMPLTRWMPGAALLGFLCAFVVWLVVGWSVSPDVQLLAMVKTSVVLAAAFGIPIGVGFWYQGRRYQRTGKWS